MAMTKAKIKEEIKKPDPLLSIFQYATDWVRANTRTCIIAAIAVVVVGLAAWGYGAYKASENEKAQYTLSQGIRSFQEYALTGKGDALSSAETSFKGVAKEGPGDARSIARLYLARIAAMKGNKEEARKLYSEIAKKSSNDTVRKLSESALQGLEKK
jgi:hypothetical protein